MGSELMSTARPTTLRVWSFLGLTTGGTLLAIGALMPWAAIRPFLDAQVRGVDVIEGTLALIAGVCVLLAMLAMRVVGTLRGRVWLASVVLVLSVGAVIAALSYVARADDRDLRAGVWVVVVGGIVAAGGAIASIAWARESATATPDPGTSNGSPPRQP